VVLIRMLKAKVVLPLAIVLVLAATAVVGTVLYEIDMDRDLRAGLIPVLIVVMITSNGLLLHRWRKVLRDESRSES
jgi:hypothetical protein